MIICYWFCSLQIFILRLLVYYLCSLIPSTCDSFIHDTLKALRNTTVTESATYFIKILRKIFPPTPFISSKIPNHPVYSIPPPRLFILSKTSSHPVYSRHESNLLKVSAHLSNLDRVFFRKLHCFWVNLKRLLKEQPH